MAFVITQNDCERARYSEEDIRTQIANKLMESIDLRNLHLPVFLKRLHKNHVVVDYTCQRKDELIGILARLTAPRFGGDGYAMKTAAFNEGNFHANHLNNLLCKAMDEEISTFEHDAKKVKHDIEIELMAVGTLAGCVFFKCLAVYKYALLHWTCTCAHPCAIAELRSSTTQGGLLFVETHRKSTLVNF
jgi:hypothetical protein